MKPSAAAVLAALRERGPRGLTDLEAIRVIGTSRLAARIWELRRAGYVIEGHQETTPKGARIRRYVLPTETESRAMWGDR